MSQVLTKRKKKEAKKKEKLDTTDVFLQGGRQEL
jgi:hypothetical protein